MLESRAFQYDGPQKIDGEELIPVLPPWGFPEEWNEINLSLNRLTRLHQPRLKRAAKLARGIQARLESIFPLLDELCAQTCLFCPDPCCLSAKVWIDFQDLLFLHLSRQRVPQIQLLKDINNNCRCWSHRGCTLPRIVRPWICTWYLCPAQSANLCRKPADDQDIFNRTIQAIKADRKQMEDAFIRAVYK
jgi:hypothetical protein